MRVSPRVRRGLAPHVVRLKDAALGRDVLGLLRELRTTERLPEDQLRELQATRLGAVLAWAGAHAPYYRELFREGGIDPRAIRDPSDLARIPVLTRSLVRARNAELVAPKYRRGFVQTVHTSGSTGEPLSVQCDAPAMSHHLANRLRGRAWHGIAVGDPELRVWDDPRAYVGQSLAKRAFWTADAVKDRLLNVRKVAATDLSEGALASWERELRRVRPAVIYGYASSICLFARYLHDRGTECRDLPVRAVVLTGEKAMPDQKRLVADVLDAAVVEEYGSAECGIIAFECPEGRLHTSDESVVLEIAEPDADGMGPLLVTTLSNRVMPLVRYEIGDVGSRSAERCPCGRGLGIVREVAGRSTDFLVDWRRQRVHAFRLMHVLQRFSKIVRYRIVQRAVGAVELVAHVTTALDESETARIVFAFREALGEETDVRIRYVSAIPVDASGKHRFLVNPKGEALAQAWRSDRPADHS